MRKVSWNITYLLTVTMSLASASILGKLSDIVKDVAVKEVPALVHPVADLAFDVVNVLCPAVRGVLYFDTEPDLSKLNLQYRSSNITEIFYLSTAAEDISEHFNLENGLCLYLHGFTDTPDSKKSEIMFEAFEKNRKSDNCTFLIADLSSVISKGPRYLFSVNGLPFVGPAMAEVVVALFDKGLSPNNTHLIGHSLGAHAAGFIGKSIYNKTGEHIGRITALDPAKPCYGMNIPEEMKLKKTDADKLVVIHTDMGVFGTEDVFGDVDFYPNGGYNQPGCADDICSHEFAVNLMAESITSPDGLLAVACDSMEDFRKANCNKNDTSLMGYFTPNDKYGKYFLQTRPSTPLGLGGEGIHFNNNSTGLVQDVQNTFENILPF